MPSLIVQWQQTCISAERHIYSPGNKVLVRQVWQVTLQCIFVQDCWETGLFISDARTLINTRRAREQWCLHLQQGLSIIFTRSRLLLWSFLCILNRLERYHCSRIRRPWIRAARLGKSPNQMCKLGVWENHWLRKAWRHELKISEILGQCGRQNMLWPYL